MRTCPWPDSWRERIRAPRDWSPRVPAGFSRVYVRLGDEPFSPRLWQRRLNEGRSFVTNGPLLDVTLDGKPFGDPLGARQLAPCQPDALQLGGEIFSEYPLDRIEVLLAGEIVATVKPECRREERRYVYRLANVVTTSSSTWIAIRCFERLPNGRLRFAHSAPVFANYSGSTLRPRRDQVHYLLQRCEAEIERNLQTLSNAELAEYREAAEFYRAQLATAR